MKTLLITGFEPFGGETINPAWEAVKALPEQIGGWQLRKLQIPTVFSLAAARTLACAAECRPDAVLCIGQAGTRSAVTPEYVGINLRHARIADNLGNQPQDEPVVPGGPTAYFATVPVRAMTAAIEAQGIPGPPCPTRPGPMSAMTCCTRSCITMPERRSAPGSSMCPSCRSRPRRAWPPCRLHR